MPLYYDFGGWGRAEGCIWKAVFPLLHSFYFYYLTSFNRRFAERKILKSYISALVGTFHLLASLAFTLIWWPPQDSDPRDAGVVSVDRLGMKGAPGRSWMPALGTVLVVAWHMSCECPHDLSYCSEQTAISNLLRPTVDLFRALHYVQTMIQGITTTNCNLLCSSFLCLLWPPLPAMNV